VKGTDHTATLHSSTLPYNPVPLGPPKILLPYSWTPSAYVPPLVWETKFHTHTKCRLLINELCGKIKLVKRETDVQHFEAQKKVKVFSLQFSQFPKTFVFGRFPGLFRLSFWWKQHIDEDEYGACGGMISREENRSTWYKPVLIPPSHTTDLLWTDCILTRPPGGRWLTARAMARPVQSFEFIWVKQKFSTYLRENKVLVHYKDQPVNAIYGNHRCLLW
jgi:hypothetical protein